MVRISSIVTLFTCKSACLLMTSNELYSLGDSNSDSAMLVSATVLAAPYAQFPTLVFPRATGGNVTTINAGANAVGKGQGAQFIGGT